MDHIIDAAVAKCGGLKNLAAAMGQSSQVIGNWRSRGIPLNQCALLEAVSDGVVTRRDMRPDDWHIIWPELVTADHPAPERAAA